MRTAIVWFRQDLRVRDNPALAAAAASGHAVMPLFVWAPEEEGEWAPGGASQWWLHHSLEALDRELRALGSRLVIRAGESAAALLALCRSSDVAAIYWNRRYEPAVIARDAAIKEQLAAAGVPAHSFNGSLLFEPWEIQTGAKGPYKVFTPFSRSCRARGVPRPTGEGPLSLTAPARWPDSIPLRALELEPKIDWAAGIRARWTPGEQGAAAVLQTHLRRALPDYATGRDLPAEEGTSRLAPHLHFGEISPARVWEAVERSGGAGAETYQQQLLWREFGYHLLFHFPATVTSPLRKEFEQFPWSADRSGLRAWQRGRTGYPFVDAGMRELWTTGWMHNRVRMVAASFLVKHLLIPWQEGARWFWDTLLDADLANNTLGWQWTAGCGADAAPYFRIFNPVSQGKRFDPAGEYTKKWCPELAGLPSKWVHAPWDAPPEVLRKAGVILGQSYPHPLIDHQEARGRALEAYDELPRSGSST